MYCDCDVYCDRDRDREVIYPGSIIANTTATPTTTASASATTTATPTATASASTTTTATTTPTAMCTIQAAS